MFASKLRWFSSSTTSRKLPPYELMEKNGKKNVQLTLQQVSKDIQLSYNAAGTKKRSASTVTKKYFEFNRDFISSVNVHQMQKELLQIRVEEKFKSSEEGIELEIIKDTPIMGKFIKPLWDPSKYVQDIIQETRNDTKNKLQNPQKNVQTEEDDPTIAATASSTSTSETKELPITPTATASSSSGPGGLPFWEINKRKETIQASFKPVQLIKTGKEIHFMNGYFLTRFISDGGKILPRWRTGLTSKQQRKLTREIQKARQLGIIPIMQKYLPGFEADLPNQTLPNPLAGLWKPTTEWKDPYTAAIEQAEAHLGDLQKFTEACEDELEQESAIEFQITFGLDQVDSLKTEDELVKLLKTSEENLMPPMYSLVRLRFRAADAALDSLPTAELKQFLERLGGDVSDCVDDDDLYFRAHQYVDAFEDQLLADSSSYNKIKTDLKTQKLLLIRQRKTSNTVSGPQSLPSPSGGSNDTTTSPSETPSQ
jgi:ribosomal protein S18